MLKALDALWRQLLDTVLQGNEQYAVIEAECLRLFRDLHVQDPLYRRQERAAGQKLTNRKLFAPSNSGSSTATSTFRRRTSGYPSSTAASSAGVPGRCRGPPRQVHETEAAVEDDGETEAEPSAEEVDEQGERGLEEVLQASAEALASMREARTRLAEVRKDRGYRGPGLGAGRPKPETKSSLAISQKEGVGERLCFDCGGWGHGAGVQWLEQYVTKLQEAPASVRALLSQPEAESFKFGNGGVLTSSLRWHIPVVIGEILEGIWVSAVNVPSLGLLLGRD